MPLPLSKAQVAKGTAWLLAHFGPDIRTAVIGKPYTSALLCAIACKETGFIWISRTDTMSPVSLLPRLVGDASGDVRGHPRQAFPTNTAVFRAKFGDTFTNTLIAEANLARTMRGLRPAQIVYKGYGLFQYDLQHVLQDQVFFEHLLWHTIGPCLARCTQELDRAFARARGDIREGVRRYNGSGAAAETYADHVLAFAAWATMTISVRESGNLETRRSVTSGDFLPQKRPIS